MERVPTRRETHPQFTDAARPLMLAGFIIGWVVGALCMICVAALEDRDE